MHLDDLQLASYIDGGIDEAERAAVRAHVLTCSRCAARLELLQADARRIATTLSRTVPAPDVRAAVRARRRRGIPGGWLARGSAFAGTLVALLLFAMLIGVRSGGTVGRVPDRLLVVDQQNGQLVELDAADGRRMGATAVGANPSKVLYDGRRGRLYVLTTQGVVSVDSQTLQVAGRWETPPPFDLNAQMALDEQHSLLYVSQPSSGTIARIDTKTFTLSQSLPVGTTAGALLLTPDGRTLFTFGAKNAILAVDLANDAIPHTLAQRDPNERGILALSPDAQALYFLRLSDQPLLQRIDARSGQTSAPVALDDGPQPWSFLLLDAGHLAIARGDGRRGGVEIVATNSFQVTARLEPAYDQHNLAVGPAGSLFALNWLHGTVTRFNTEAATMSWQTPQTDWKPKDGAFVAGGWRWPWEPAIAR